MPRPITESDEHQAPTSAAAALYVGNVMHARLKPVGHRFNYRVMALLIDLDRLSEADRQSPLFGVNRAALYSFHEADHGRRDGSSLRDYAKSRAADHGIDLEGGRVLLLCYPRLMGYAFNPLSVYFCYHADGAPALVIYEVRNTFGDTHAYALPVRADEISAAGIRQCQDKLFYVSPFIEMAMRYHFRVSPPEHSVRLRILETDREGPLLAATFHGRRRALTTATLLWLFALLPFFTFKIIAAIHWEALRLWLKGIRPARVPAKWNPARRQGHAPTVESTAFPDRMGSLGDPIRSGNAVAPRANAGLASGECSDYSARTLSAAGKSGSRESAPVQ